MSNEIQYLGHSFFKISVGPVTLLIDPFFRQENPKIERLIKCPVSVKQLKNIDLILITHEHFDHFEKDSIKQLVEKNNCLVLAHNSILQEIDIKDSFKVAIDSRKSFNFKGVEIKAFHVHHTNSFYPLGFRISRKNFSLIHFGDAVLTDAMPKFDAKVILIPIGGKATFDVTDAVRVIKMIKPEIAIPMHFNTFEFIKVSPKDFKDKLSDSKIAVQPVILKPKEIFSVS